MTTPENKSEPSSGLIPRQLGRAALPDTEVATHTTSVEWQRAAHTPTFRFDELHLGRYRDTSAEAFRYHDQAEVIVPDGGFRIRLTQGSHGPVVVSAQAETGYQVEVAELDEDRRLNWRAKESWRDDVVLAADGGNLSAVAFKEWNDANLGNPGVYWGVVRITEAASKTVCHFAVGANFSGQPDDWRVDGTVLAVEPADTLVPIDEPASLPPSADRDDT